jgi:hypothetical protein
MEPLIRFKGKWIKIIPKPHEPERQMFQTVWMKLNGQAFNWFEKERLISKIVYNE